MGSRRAALILAVLASAALSACGFRPLYGARGGALNVPADLAAVSIAPIPDRLGQAVRNHLLDDFNPAGAPGAPRHRLEVTLASNREGLGYRRDELITRVNLWLSATYRLIELGSERVVIEDQARSVASFDVVQSDFSTLTAERDAEDRLAEALSREITVRVAAYFEGLAAGER